MGGAPQAPSGANDAYLRNLVKSADRDLYWSVLFAPPDTQSALLAIHTLSLELARIPDQVSETQLGEIRLQWWLDALAAAVGDGRSDHPVIDPVAKAAQAYGLPLAAFEEMITARRRDLHAEQPEDGPALRAYLDAVYGSAFRLGAAIVGAQPTPDGIAAAAGAYGRIRLLRSFPLDAARGRIFLPQSLLAKHGLHANAILSGADNPDLRAALRDMRGEAAEAIETARAGFSRLPRLARPAFLPLATAPAYLRKMLRSAGNPFEEVVELNPLIRYGAIWRAFVSGRF